MKAPKVKALPARLKPFFWDCNFKQLRWDNDRDFIINRILLQGDWDSLRWLTGRKLNKPFDKRSSPSIRAVHD
jgi:hypothetical protein